MKNDDHEHLGSLLSIFTGYQAGIAVAMLIAVFLVTIYLLPDAVAPLIILTAVLVVPYLFIRKSAGDEPDDQ